MCNCGCNTCETKGPLLTEGKVKSLLSEGLQYHIDKKIPLFETVYRIGSDKHLALIKEARKMYSRNVIDLCEDDEALIKTHLGEFALYEGESVPLDLPMLNESYDYDEVAQSEFGMDYDQLGPGEKEWVRDEIDNMSMSEAYSGFLKNPEDPDSEKFEPTGSVAQFREELRALFGKFKGDLKNPEFIKGVAQIMVNWKSLLRSQLNENKAIITFKNDYEVKMNTGEGYDDDFENFEAGEREQVYILDKNDKRVHVEFGDGTNAYIPTSLISIQDKSLNEDEQLDEKKKAKKKEKKDPPLNKPKRGGSKAYYVYVRDPKTKKIKKVSFGSGGLRAKIKNKEARNAFAARHNCKNKKDRTKAGYWSCNLPRYAPALGLGAKMNTFW